MFCFGSETTMSLNLAMNTVFVLSPSFEIRVAYRLKMRRFDMYRVNLSPKLESSSVPTADYVNSIVPSPLYRDEL